MGTLTLFSTSKPAPLATLPGTSPKVPGGRKICRVTLQIADYRHHHPPVSPYFTWHTLIKGSDQDTDDFLSKPTQS